MCSMKVIAEALIPELNSKEACVGHRQYGHHHKPHNDTERDSFESVTVPAEQPVILRRRKFSKSHAHGLMSLFHVVHALSGIALFHSRL